MNNDRVSSILRQFVDRDLTQGEARKKLLAYGPYNQQIVDNALLGLKEHHKTVSEAASEIIESGTG